MTETMTPQAVVACYLAAWNRAERTPYAYPDRRREAQRDEEAWLARLAQAVGGYTEACAMIAAEYELTK